MPVIWNPHALDNNDDFCRYLYIQVYTFIICIYLYIRVYTDLSAKHIVYTSIYIYLTSKLFPDRGIVS